MQERELTTGQGKWVVADESVLQIVMFSERNLRDSLPSPEITEHSS